MRSVSEAAREWKSGMHESGRAEERARSCSAFKLTLPSTMPCCCYFCCFCCFVCCCCCCCCCYVNQQQCGHTGTKYYFCLSFVFSSLFLGSVSPRGSVSVNCRKALHFEYRYTHTYLCMCAGIHKYTHTYISAGLSTYFYGLSARLHVSSLEREWLRLRQSLGRHIIHWGLRLLGLKLVLLLLLL